MLRTSRHDVVEGCPAGGVLIEAGHDRDCDGELSDEEVESCAPICDPEDSLLERVTPIESCDECEFGGRRIERGFDDNGNGRLDDNEVVPSMSSVECHEPRYNVAGARLYTKGEHFDGSEFVSDSPRFIHYVLDLGSEGVNTDQLIDEAKPALELKPTAFGVRTAYAIDLLDACCGTDPLKFDSMIEYVQPSGTHTDLLIGLAGNSAAADIGAVALPFAGPNPVFAKQLWTELLTNRALALQNLAPSDAADKGMLVVFVQGRDGAEILKAGYELLDETLKSDTLVVMVETRGDDTLIYHAFPQPH